MTTVSGHLTGIAASAPHAPAGGDTRYGTYWLSWVALLALTAVMLFAETLSFTRGVSVTVLLGAMLVKAGVICAWFMHLRFERPALVWSVVGATVLTGAALFGLIAPDGIAMLRQATH